MKKTLSFFIFLLLNGCFLQEKNDKSKAEEAAFELAQEQTQDQAQEQTQDQAQEQTQGQKEQEKLASANRNSCLNLGYSLELCNALNTGNPSNVEEKELLQFAEDNIDRLIAEQESLIEYLYENNQNYSYSNVNTNVFIASPAMNSRIVLYANKDGRTNAIKDTYKIAGVLEKTDHRVGLFTINLLSLSQEQAIKTFNKNLIKWFVKEKTSNLSIVFSHFTPARYEENKAFILEYYPEAMFNNYGECDFQQLSTCIDNLKPDLILYSTYRNTDQYYEDVEQGIKKASLRKIPFMAIMEGTLMSGNGKIMMQPIYDWLGHPYAEQGYGNAKPHAESASVNELKNLTSLTEIKKMIQRMRDGNFSESAIDGCSASSTIISCSHAEYLEEFGNAANYVRNLLQNKEAKKVDVFRSYDSDNFLKSILLLADKYRSQVDYPIHKSETHDYMKALFADLFIYYARSDNQAQPDLGQHVVDARYLTKGSNANYNHPQTVTDRKSISTTHNTSDTFGTTTGWYALPGKPVTLIRHDSNDMKVKVQLHYGRYGTNRLTKTGYYYGPVEQYTRRLSLENGESLTFSTPMGAPIYLSIYGEENLAVNVTAKNVALHPTVDNFASQEQIDNFVDTFLNTETPHVDLKMHGAEFHMRKDRYLTGNVSAEQVIERLRSTREDHIQLLHRVAALSVEGKPLEETLPKDVISVCSDMLGEEDCLDPKLHTRAGTQHANFDQNAQCGAGCSGNPWDSKGMFVPTSWLAFHEAGHNLQTGFIGGYEVAKADRNDWSKYVRRSHENSNNIFSYIGLWNYWYIAQGNKEQYSGTGHKNSETLFYPIMSDALEKGAVYSNKDCDIYPGANRFEAIWSSSGQNHPRLSFHMQMTFIADDMKMANGTVLKHGYDLISLFYQHSRIFVKYSANETLWNENKDRLGFSTFPWTGMPTYGDSKRTVRHIPGNDFMLISLSHLTGHDWSDFFNLVGLYNSDMALEQSRINGRQGKVPKGLYMINAEYPIAEADGTLGVKGHLQFVDLSSPNKDTTWYGNKFTCGE